MKSKIFIAMMSVLMFQTAAIAQQCPMQTATLGKLVDNVGSFRSSDGNIEVRVQNSNVDQAGTLFYGGPVEVLDGHGKSICNADLENLHQPFAFAKDQYLYFLTGDATDVALKVIDLKSCRVVWKSAAYSWDNAPNIVPTASSIYLAKKKISVGSDCLPPAKTGK